MRVPTQKQRPRKAQVSFMPAPTGGLISNRNLSMANAPDLPPGAEVLENWFPTATGVTLRRGSRRWATLGTDPVRSMFTYISGSQQRFFAADDTAIYNITSIVSPFNWALAVEEEEVVSPDPGNEVAFGGVSVEGLDVYANTSGDWVVVQFATAAGEFLIGVNGTDTGFIYDGDTFYPSVADGLFALDYDALATSFTEGETVTGGTSGATAEIVSVIENGALGRLWIKDISGTFQDDENLTDGAGGDATADGTAGQIAPGISFPVGVALTTADLSYVWVYKERIYFVQKDSLDVWYLDVDQVGGELTKLPLGGVFTRGGTLIWGQSWSLDSGGSGGLSEQCVFTTTEGEVAAYQGLSPEVDQGWDKVGIYRIGRPMGKKGFIRAGGDLVIATTVGFVSLASASRRDYAALGQNAVSYPIEDAWARAQQERGQNDWRCQIWADGQMTLIAPPTPENRSPIVFVVNTNTGRWCTFTGWDITAMVDFQGQFFFGSTNGAIRQGWVGGQDEDQPYVGKCLPLFDNMKAPANLKILKMARAVTKSAYEVKIQLSGHANYKANFPAPPSQQVIPTGNEWDNGIWGQSIWDAERGSIVTGDWVSVGGSGHDVSVGTQVTSGATVPIDVELVRVDVTYITGDAGT